MMLIKEYLTVIEHYLAHWASLILHYKRTNHLLNMKYIVFLSSKDNAHLNELKDSNHSKK
jgi:hypothetical protein